MSFKVYPYKPGSRGAKALSEAVEGKVLKHVGSKYKPRAGDVVVNWGASDCPDFAPATTLNRNVARASCKLATFQMLEVVGVDIPPFATSEQEVCDKDFKFPVVCRTKLRGHSGDGIVIANNPEELVQAPLYTQYVKKKDEYRVQVLGGKAFFIQRKARKLDVENPDWQVRNLAGGFVFVEEGAVVAPKAVIDNAVRAVAALGLDFGGVDVIWNEAEEKAYVLEINCACGLEQRSAEKYAEALRNL